MSISATIFGRLTGDPQQKTPQNGGNPYVNFSIASNTSRKDNNNNNIAQFINISVFGKRGEVIMQYFRKGSRIAVHLNNLEAHAWVGQQDGQAHASLNAVLSDFDFIDTAAESGQQPQSAPPAPQPNRYAPPAAPAPNRYAAPPATAPAAGYATAPAYAAPPATAPAAAPGSTPWA